MNARRPQFFLEVPWSDRYARSTAPGLGCILLLFSLLACGCGKHPGPTTGPTEGTPPEQPATGTGPVKNAGFETSLDSSWTTHVFGARAQIDFDTQVFHEGRRSLRIRATAPSDTALGQEVTLKPGRRYRFTGWVRTEGLQPRGANTHGTFLIMRPGGKAVIARGTNHGGTMGWTEVPILFQAPPDGRIRIGIFFVGFGKGTGTAWFDDLKLEEVEDTGTSAPAAPAWTLDLKQMQIPDRPAAGQLHGRPFKPAQARWEKGVLTLRQGQEFFPDLAVDLFLHLDEAESLAGRTIEIAPGKAGSDLVPDIHLQWRESGQNLPRTEFIHEGYALKLVLGKEDGEKIPGQIYLSLPDVSRSVLAGTFAVELPPDYSKPPRPSELPCIYGKIALTGRDKFKLKVGYVGRTTQGQVHSNAAGTMIGVNDSGNSVSSLSFKPRVTTLVADRRSGCNYRHVKLEPGNYLVYVSWEDHFVLWQPATVQANSRLNVDFRIDPAEAGSLEVRTKLKADNQPVSLLPLQADGKPPALDVPPSDLSWSLGGQVTCKNGQAVFPIVRAGKYCVSLGKAQAEVTVKPGHTARVELKE